MLFILRYAFLSTLLIFSSVFGYAASNSSHVEVEIFSEEDTFQPNRPFWVAVRLKIDKEWHVYWKNPGETGAPLELNWDLPEGFQSGHSLWPFPQQFTMADIKGFGYENEVILLTEIIPPAHFSPESKHQLKGNISWLVCSSTNCQPGSIPLSLEISGDTKSPLVIENHRPFFEQARSKIPLSSSPQLKATRKNGIVQIEIPYQGKVVKENLKEVYFFPEEQNIIDHSTDPIIAAAETNDRFLLKMKSSEETKDQNLLLKGVLVLHNETTTGMNVQAFTIESLIENESDQGILSYAGQPIIETKTATAHSASVFEGGLSLALLFAFLGGMLLNLMPCVLPVMSFKVMSFVKMAGKSRSLTLKHGLMFSFGVLISFWILASVMLILRSYGQSVGWGFQLQEPLFVIVLATLLFLFSLSLFGVFELGLSVSSWAGQTETETNKQSSSGFVSSFFSGVLATAVATPCTGPFLGSAVGFAVTLPFFQALLIFTSLALGMSAPYLILAAYPSLLRFLPKPGKWMETFKELMGFVLLTTVLWLLWVFSAQTNTFSLICVLGGFLCFSLGAWIYGRGSSPMTPRPKRLLAYASTLVLVLCGIQAISYPRHTWDTEEIAMNDPSIHKSERWENFSPELIAHLKKENKPILIDFTAKWCLICQANHVTLSSEKVNERLADLGVIKVKADWTKHNPAITQALSEFGRNSVPLYVLYTGNEEEEPLILPQVLTADIVLDYLSQIEKKEG